MDTIKNKVDVTQSKLLSSPIMTTVPLFRNFCKFTKKKKKPGVAIVACLEITCVYHFPLRCLISFIFFFINSNYQTCTRNIENSRLKLVG